MYRVEQNIHPYNIRRGTGVCASAVIASQNVVDRIQFASVLFVQSSDEGRQQAHVAYEKRGVLIGEIVEPDPLLQPLPSLALSEMSQVGFAQWNIASTQALEEIVRTMQAYLSRRAARQPARGRRTVIDGLLSSQAQKLFLILSALSAELKETRSSMNDAHLKDAPGQH